MNRLTHIDAEDMAPKVDIGDKAKDRARRAGRETSDMEALTTAALTN